MRLRNVIQDPGLLTALLEHVYCIREMFYTNIHQAQAFLTAGQPIWETAPEPLQTNSLCQGDPRVAEPLPAHLWPVFFTDAPW